MAKTYKSKFGGEEEDTDFATKLKSFPTHLWQVSYMYRLCCSECCDTGSEASLECIMYGHARRSSRQCLLVSALLRWYFT